MHLEVWIATKRSLMHAENEDRAVVGDEVFDEISTVEHRRLAVPGMLVALDGLGGHSSGQVASQLAAKMLAGSEVPTDGRAAATTLELADRTLHDAMETNPAVDGMGATVAMLAVLDGTLVAANAGDASAWRYADGSLEELSVSDRLEGSRVLQCLGAHHDISPHVKTAQVAVGDRLLLASDGLTDVVPTDRLAQALGGAVEDAAQHLLSMVEDARFPDDVTIVVAEVRAD